MNLQFNNIKSQLYISIHHLTTLRHFCGAPRAFNRHYIIFIERRANKSHEPIYTRISTQLLLNRVLLLLFSSAGKYKPQRKLFSLAPGIVCSSDFEQSACLRMFTEIAPKYYNFIIQSTVWLICFQVFFIFFCEINRFIRIYSLVMFDETNGTQISSGPQWKVAHIYSTDNAKRQTKKNDRPDNGFWHWLYWGTLNTPQKTRRLLEPTHP